MSEERIIAILRYVMEGLANFEGAITVIAEYYQVLEQDRIMAETAKHQNEGERT